MTFWRIDLPQDDSVIEAYDSLEEAQASADEDTKYVLEVAAVWEPKPHYDFRRRRESRFSITGWKQTWPEAAGEGE